MPRYISQYKDWKCWEIAFSCILGIRLISCESLSANTGPSLLALSVNICFVGFIEPKKEMVSGCEI